MTENIHICKCCNYQTKRIGDFNKHLKTIKHQKNSETNQNESPTNHF